MHSAQSNQLLDLLQQLLKRQFRAAAVSAISRLHLRLLQAAADTLGRLGLRFREVDPEPIYLNAILLRVVSAPSAI